MAKLSKISTPMLLADQMNISIVFDGNSLDLLAREKPYSPIFLGR